MLRNLKKIFVPHESNNFHPYSVRAKSILGYAALLLLLNYLVFPALGIDYSSAKASDLDADGIINLANESRHNAGIAGLRQNPLLSEAALMKGQDMFQKQYWDHYGSGGETPWQFMKLAGYEYIYAGENLAKDFHSNVDVHNAWMNSLTHKQNILNPYFSDIGLATVSGQLFGSETTIIVVMFGSRDIDIDSNNINLSSRPEITNPISGEVFESKNITLEGKTESGDTIKIFSNNDLIGELPRNGGAFTTNINLVDEKNELFIKSYDSKSGAESEKSNIVAIEIVDKSRISNSIRGASIISTKDYSLSRIGERLRTLSLGEKINSLIILVISIFVMFDIIFLATKGIKRDHSSHHGFHLGLVLIVMLGVLTI